MRTVLGCLLWTFAVAALAGAGDFYTQADYAHVAKIDAHVHLHGEAARYVALARAEGFRVLTINVDYPDFPPIDVQQRDAVALRARAPDIVAFAGTFDVAAFGTPDWPGRALAQIDSAVAQGAVGIKIWKNIGMSLQDTDGRYVMIDDARFEPVLAHLEQHGIVLLAHQAEPLNCWLPMDRMTVASDREYFAAHPQYYMYRHPGMPSHEAILAARDRMMRRHPGLAVDAVHLASLEWDVDRVAGFLDRFPAARVDLAARMIHLEYQASRHPKRVRDFLIRYRDRILYGSDDAYGPGDEDERALADVRTGWREDWTFLATSSPMKSAEFSAPFRGLHLPRDVLDRIYRLNAEALFPRAWSSPQ